MNSPLPTIYIISDGTGETASTMVQAAIIQFPDQEVHLVRCKNVRTESQVENLIEQISEKKGFIVHTVVSPQLSKKIIEESAINSIRRDAVLPAIEAERKQSYDLYAAKSPCNGPLSRVPSSA